MGRLRRGHSLEVIFEEEFPADMQSSIDQLEELTDVEEWEKHPKRLSRRHILQQQQQEQQQEQPREEYSNPESVQVTLCSSCCLKADMDNNAPQQQQQQGVPRRRNSTYLALACANAVSQGAMTRSLRQMFETQPIRETQPLLSRAEIKQAIQAARLRRNSIAVCPSSPEPEIVTAVPAVVIDVGSKELPSPARQSLPLHNKVGTSLIETASPRPATMSPPGGVRCDKCSSILTTSPVSLVIKTGVGQVPEEEPATNNKSPAKIIPTNREVVEEELPKPDTVKNARCLFESSLMEVTGSGFSTLQPIKSNPSSKILRSESTMTLDRAGTRASSLASRPPFRWPSRQEHVRSARSPSPSPSPSPVPALTVPVKSHKMSSTLPSYYRSSPSLTQYRSSRHSLHSTDVESYVSEGGSDCWSSDLESEASYSSCSRDESASDTLDGMRYISPDVMEKIRSYGMTLTFVNGKMVDEDDDEDEPEQVAKYAATRKVVQSIRSAGQSQPIAAKKSAPPVAPKKVKEYPADPANYSTPQQPRIVACVPKPSEQPLLPSSNNNSNLKKNKNRHSSGESSTSSGVSSGTNAGSDGSEHNSPFATLKRTKSADADHTVERSPSPGPRQSGTVKAIGSSPFGCYSVVYSFDASARSPMYV